MCVLCRKRTIYSKCVLWRIPIPTAQYVSGDVQSLWALPRPPLSGAPKHRLGRGRVTSSSLSPFQSVHLVRKPFLTTYHSGSSSAGEIRVYSALHKGAGSELHLDAVSHSCLFSIPLLRIISLPLILMFRWSSFSRLYESRLKNICPCTRSDQFWRI